MSAHMEQCRRSLQLREEERQALLEQRFEYDWDSIDFLRRKFDRLRPCLDADLNRFREFLLRLGAAPCGQN